MNIIGEWMRGRLAKAGRPKARSIIGRGLKPLKWKPKIGLVRLSNAREQLFKKLMKIPGNTPLETVDWLPNKNRLHIKMEFANKPTGSHYDRVYPKLLRALERIGINPNDFTLAETSSGNATPAFGYFAKRLGYETVAFLPAELSARRRTLSKKQCDRVVVANDKKHGWGVFGAANAMKEALARNREERKKNTKKKRMYCVDHSQVTEGLGAIKSVADEIVKQLKVEKPDYFLGIAGNGTILYGVGRELKKRFPNMKVIAIEPFERPVLHQLKYPGRYEKEFGRKPPSVEDMLGKEFFAPGSGALGVQFPHIHSAVDLVDDIILVKKGETTKALEQLKKKGHAVGHTSGMSYVAAKKLAKTKKGKSIVTIFYDLINRY